MGLFQTTRVNVQHTNIVCAYRTASSTTRMRESSEAAYGEPQSFHAFGELSTVKAYWLMAMGTPMGASRASISSCLESAAGWLDKPPR